MATNDWRGCSKGEKYHRRLQLECVTCISIKGPLMLKDALRYRFTHGLTITGSRPIDNLCDVLEKTFLWTKYYDIALAYRNNATVNTCHKILVCRFFWD